MADTQLKEFDKLSKVLEFPTLIQPPPIVDDPSVPEVFTDNLAGLTINQGNVNLTFATVRADHSKTPATNHRKITSRLVMPISVAVSLYEILGQVTRDLEEKGLIQKGPVPPGPVMQ
jgi:hypothetical protein